MRSNQIGLGHGRVLFKNLLIAKISKFHDRIRHGYGAVHHFILFIIQIYRMDIRVHHTDRIEKVQNISFCIYLPPRFRRKAQQLRIIIDRIIGDLLDILKIQLVYGSHLSCRNLIGFFHIPLICSALRQIKKQHGKHSKDNQQHGDKSEQLLSQLVQHNFISVFFQQSVPHLSMHPLFCINPTSSTQTVYENLCFLSNVAYITSNTPRHSDITSSGWKNACQSLLHH